MDNTFIYNGPVSGRNFLGGKSCLDNLSDILGRGMTPVLYEPSGSGKSSLLKQYFAAIGGKGIRVNVIELSLAPFRTAAGFLEALVSACGRFAHNPADSGIIRIADSDEDVISALSLPFSISAQTLTRTFVVLDQFQNLMLTDSGERILKIMEAVLDGQKTDGEPLCSYILCGSEVNAMKEIFEHRKFLYHQTERCRLEPVGNNEIIDYIIRGFTSGGKVVDRDLLENALAPFGGQLHYAMQFAANCDYLSRGYIMEPVLDEAYEMVLATREASYLHLLNDLTDFQLNLIRALLDGYRKFSSSEVIRKYGLNSSANVCRIKEALCKKEILSFDENDEASMTDPLFEHWLRTLLK